MILRRLAFPLFVLLGTSCTEGVLDDSDAGPCLHEYREPVLHITAATGSPSGTAIPEVDLTTFTVDGAPRSTQSLTLSQSYNATATENTLHCVVPCGFAVEEGEYRFTAAAPNHASKEITVEAAFHTFHGGCPSFNDGGTRFEVELVES